jgi:hypothetical protein
MKMKSFALLAMPVLLAASFAYTAPVFADDMDAMNNDNPMLAENDVQNQNNMMNNNNSNSMGNNYNNSTNNNTNSNPNSDEGSPDTAPSNGDDDY